MASMVYEIEENGQVIETFGERINGRFLSEPICDPATGELLFDTNTIIYQKDAEAAGEATASTTAKVRSVLTCHARNGVCSKCYGLNLAHPGTGWHWRGCGHHRRTVHRRARYPADHAYLPLPAALPAATSPRVCPEWKNCSKHAVPRRWHSWQRSPAWLP